MVNNVEQLLKNMSSEKREVVERDADELLNSIYGFGSVERPIREWPLIDKVRLIQELDAAPRGYNRITAEEVRGRYSGKNSA